MCDRFKKAISRGDAAFAGGKFGEAANEYRQALGFKSRAYAVRYNLGVALAEIGDYKEAEEHIKRSITEGFRSHVPYQKLGNIAERAGNPANAIEFYERAIEINGDAAESHFNLALCMLRIGRYREGWLKYEWRWEAKKIARPEFGVPRWNGKQLRGCLLLYCEQGLGDSIQFVRFVRCALELCDEVALLTPDSLTRLFENSLPQVTVVGASRLQQLPAFDAHEAVMSLPYQLGLDRELDIPESPYLFAPGSRCQTKPLKLGKEKIRIGIVWRGNPNNPGEREIPVENLIEAVGREDVEVVSVQKLPETDEIYRLREGGIIDLSEYLTDFSETAFLLRGLDLIVTSDCAVAHLAGAIGCQVFVLLPWLADWRWQDRRCDSPWYEDVELFRQTRAGDWSGPLNEVAGRVSRIVAQSVR